MENIANFDDYHYANMFVPTIYIEHMCIRQEKHGTGTKILQKLGTYFNHLFYSDYLQSSIQFYRIWRI